LAVIGIRLLRALVASDTMNPSEAMVHIFTFGKVRLVFLFLLVSRLFQVLDSLGLFVFQWCCCSFFVDVNISVCPRASGQYIHGSDD
jgi:hypothetical protein